MAFNPALLTALDRIRLALGDIGTPELFADATYTALLVANANNEALAIRASAAALAAYYATQPSSLASDGSSITWGSRITQWNRIAAGIATGGIVTRRFSVTPRRNDGYAALATLTDGY